MGNKFAKWSILPAFLTLVVSMMLSMDFDIFLLFGCYIIGITAIIIAGIGIKNYVADKSIKGLGFSIAAILLALWGIIVTFARYGFN